MSYVYTLTGKPNIIQISKDGNYTMVCGYDGSVKIFGTREDKLLYKTKIKGASHYLPIHHSDISIDNRYFAFSCLFKVFVIDLQQKQIIKEYEYPKDEELVASISFCFYHREPKILVPHGRVLRIYGLDSDTVAEIALLDGAAVTDRIAISLDDEIIAYKSWNDLFKAKLLLIDSRTGTIGTVALPYQHSHSQLFMCGLQFTTDGRLVVMRKGLGFSYFDAKSGAEIHTITWDDIGFRSLHNYGHSKISTSGRYLLIHKENPEKNDINEWYVDQPDGMEHVIYDTETRAVIYCLKKNANAAAFNIEHNRFAYIASDNEDSKRKELVIRSIKP